MKIVITDEVEELITHNVFYTAITRAREKLKIYWTPETEEKVISRIKPRDISRDVEILKTYYTIEKVYINYVQVYNRTDKQLSQDVLNSTSTLSSYGNDFRKAKILYKT